MAYVVPATAEDQATLNAAVLKLREARDLADACGCGAFANHIRTALVASRNAIVQMKFRIQTTQERAGNPT